jgi:hypothetical protein
MYLSNWRDPSTVYPCLGLHWRGQRGSGTKEIPGEEDDVYRWRPPDKHSFISSWFPRVSICLPGSPPSNAGVKDVRAVPSFLPYGCLLRCDVPSWRPWYTFLVPYFTPPALTLIRISRKNYFWITVCFNFFRSTPLNTVFPFLKYCFLLYPFYCPLTPPFPFSH